MTKFTKTEIRKMLDKLSIALQKIHDIQAMRCRSTNLINAERNLQHEMSRLTNLLD